MDPEQLTQLIQGQIADLKTALLNEMLAETNPNNQRVVDLEKKLTEKLSELEENVRLIQTANAPSKPDNKPKDIFEKAFLTDRAKLRELIYARHSAAAGAETRTIDTSLFSAGGKLSPEQADQFISYTIEMQTALSRVVTRRMMSPVGYTDELRVAQRKLRKATEAAAPNLANSISFKRRTLTTVEVIWAEDISLTFLEDNIEKAGMEDTIAREIANQFGNDLNDLAWNGDENVNSAGAEPFLTINNGWIDLALSDSEVTDVDLTTSAYGPVGGSTTAATVLKYIRGAMPFQFRPRTDLRFWVPVDFAEAFANELSTRATAFGDDVLINGFPNLRFFGVPVTPEPHLTGNQADRILLTSDANLYHGIQRNITVDSEWVPRRRVVEYTITARNDYEYATGQAMVLADGLPAQLR